MDLSFLTVKASKEGQIRTEGGMDSIFLLSIFSLLTHSHFHVSFGKTGVGNMVPMSPPGRLLLYIFVLNLETLCGVGIHSSNSDLQRKRLCCENRRNVQTRALTMDFVCIRLLALRTWTVLQKF